MPITEQWNIKSRSHTCAHTGAAFVDGDAFYTALYEDPKSDELVRKDFSAAAWDEIGAQEKPFSFWRSVYEAPQPGAVKPEVVEKESAEGLLRRLIEDDAPGTENTRYVLAVMLERRRILKQTATRETEDSTFLIYENPKSGEVLIVRDPELKLNELEPVQREVSLLLGRSPLKPRQQPKRRRLRKLSEKCPIFPLFTVHCSLPTLRSAILPILFS
jgi:hypothetical protein